MKLTKYDKETFVKAVMADISDPDFATTKAIIQDEIVKGMSKEAQELYKVSPKALMTETCYEVIPKYYNVTFVVGDSPYLKIIKPWNDKYLARHSAEKKLFSSITGITTLKLLQEALPELVKYMPSEDAKTKNLPALNNVFEDLVKVGLRCE